MKITDLYLQKSKKVDNFFMLYERKKMLYYRREMKKIMKICTTFLSLAFIFAVSILLTSCVLDKGAEIYGGESYSAQITRIKKQGGFYKVGNPYKISGKWYYPKEDYNYSEVGMASWYGEAFHAKKTANGEKYDMNTLTAAHRTLPLPSIVRVTNLENGRSLILRVNDRGPYAKNRIIDISKRGATLLGYKDKGITKVKVEILEKESKMLKNALLGKKIPDEYLMNPVKQEPIKPMQITNISPKKPTAKKQFFVQAGSFSQNVLAKNLKDTLSEFGTAGISTIDINNTTFYRVRVGPFYDETDAMDMLDKLKKYGIYEAKLVKD